MYMIACIQYIYVRIQIQTTIMSTPHVHYFMLLDDMLNTQVVFTR